ncbi:GDSL-type esterase/lipase family protein [Salinibacterium sp. PAMC 21357]|uniref:GDSL-type esterase/lipase family protein n=1 Tax=Salinibacterium sp. PAMC 21357 TaxID=1112215 RepID=UPI000289AC3E|nr:GDSL-type esterase/lipase family protein [Salinibacterium sp. PAMC 21357]
MFATLGHIAMKSFLMVWLYASPHSWRGLPLPDSGPPVRVEGANLKHVLLCGSGIVVGYGVSSHELALGGSLARSLAALTGNGVEVITVTSPRLSTKSAQSQLNRQVLQGTDAALLSFGTFDLLTLLPASTWGRRMSELVDSVLTNAGSHAHVFVLDCTAPKMSNFPASYRRLLLRLTSEYNEEIRSLVERHERVLQIDFSPEPEDPEAIAGRQSYRTWAEAIAPHLAKVLS